MLVIFLFERRVKII